MAKRGVSFILIVMLVGSAVAGVPMPASEKSCPLMGMADCCKQAQSPVATPQAAAARLCCSLNCNLPGTTGSTGVEPKTPSPVLALHHALHIPASHTAILRGTIANSSPARNQHSPPIYLQHLALLI